MHGKLFTVDFKKINAFYREFFGTVVSLRQIARLARSSCFPRKTFDHDVTLIGNFLESALRHPSSQLDRTCSSLTCAGMNMGDVLTVFNNSRG